MTESSAITPARRIAIIGGGCAGTLVAVQVLRQATAPVRVRLIERRPPPGPGVAYATDRNEHRLNVAAGRMSALPGQPSHFYEWARARAGHLGFPDTIGADDFLPRWMYGQYLEQLWAEARASARPGVEAEVVLGEAVDIAPEAGGPRVILAEGRLRFHAGRLVSLREQGEGAAALIKLRGREEFLALRVAKVINCTGPRTDYSKYQHPLLVNLLAAGLIGHDPLALGIDALPGGDVLRYGGADPVGWLFTLGATLKGALWETTAVPEIRGQAEALAARLIALAARRGETEK